MHFASFPLEAGGRQVVWAREEVWEGQVGDGRSWVGASAGSQACSWAGVGVLPRMQLCPRALCSSKS